MHDEEQPTAIACARCPFNSSFGFVAHSERETVEIQQRKRGEVMVAAGETCLRQGDERQNMFTVLDGWGYRYSELEDGRRQILNFVFPGDLIGLQSALDDPCAHSVAALTQMRLCRFEAGSLHGLVSDCPEVAFDVVWLAASEERALEGHLLGIGRRSALERLAYMLSYLRDRGVQSGLRAERDPITPMTQGLLADMLGMSLVHTNKTLRQLQADGLVRWRGRRVFIDDIERLREIGRWRGLGSQKRHFV